MLLAAYTVPVNHHNEVIAENLRKYGCEITVDSPLFPKPEDPSQDALQDPPYDPQVDPVAAQGDDDEPALTEGEVKWCDLQNQKWQEHVAELSSVKVQTLTMALPLRSRNSKEVVKTVSTFYCRLRPLGLPVVRLHADRAREFVSQELQNFARDRDLWCTYTAGDQAASNGRAEASIRTLKQQVRVIMQAAKAPPEYWPLAVPLPNQCSHLGSSAMQGRKNGMSA